MSSLLEVAKAPQSGSADAAFRSINGRHGAALIALVALVSLINIGSVEFRFADEARTGVIVRDVLDEGRWLLPRTPDGYLCEKPPVYYWLCAGLSHVFGAHEWTLRVVSFAMAVGTLWLVWVLAGLYGSRRASAVAVVALAANVIFMVWARRAMVDMTLAFFLTAGLTAYFAARVGRLRAWPAAGLCGAAFGLATLTKGPLGLAFPVAVMAADVLIETRGRFWRARVAWGPAAAGLGLAMALALAWYVPALARGGRDFLETSVLSENLYMPLGRARGLGVGHGEPLYYYPMLQLAALLAMAPLLPETVRWSVRRSADPGRAQLVAWIGGGFLLFMAASNKRMHYLLPLQPALAALVGLAFDRFLNGIAPSRLLRWSAGVMGVLVVGAGVFGAVIAVDPARIASQIDVGTHRAGVAVFAGAAIALGLGLAAAAALGPRHVVPVSLALALLAPTGLSLLVTPLAARETATRDFVAAAAAKVPAGVRPVVQPPFYGYSVDFYWPHRLARDEHAAERAAWFLATKDRVADLGGGVEIVAVLPNRWEDRTIVLVRRR